MNERAVRMKIVSDILIGYHNSLRLEVMKKTDGYLKILNSPANEPIPLDDD